MGGLNDPTPFPWTFEGLGSPRQISRCFMFYFFSQENLVSIKQWVKYQKLLHFQLDDANVTSVNNTLIGHQSVYNTSGFFLVSDLYDILIYVAKWTFDLGFFIMEKYCPHHNS